MNSMELFERRDELKSIITDLRAEQKDVEQQLSDLFLPLARDALRADDKDFGTAHIVEGNVAMKVNVGKKVIWDQDVLRNTFSSMTPENAALRKADLRCGRAQVYSRSTRNQSNPSSRPYSRSRTRDSRS